jgi:3',5'-cyclic AMP phosphodiesterase CpdA
MTEADVAGFAARDMRVEIAPYAEGFAWDAERYEWSIAVANRMQPGFVVVAGDMVDDINDEAQLEELFRITALLDRDIPLHWVPGNHDAAFDTTVPTPASLERYRELFGPDRYAFGFASSRFIVLDTPILDHPEEVKDEFEDQMEFLEYELAKARESQDRIILLGHHPLFISSPDEPDTYWNIPKAQRHRVLDLVHRYDVRIAFAGHWHRNAIAFDGEFEMVTTGPVGYPLGKDPSGYRVVEIEGDDVKHQYHALVDPSSNLAPGDGRIQ